MVGQGRVWQSRLSLFAAWCVTARVQSVALQYHYCNVIALCIRLYSGPQIEPGMFSCKLKIGGILEQIWLHWPRYEISTSNSKNSANFEDRFGVLSRVVRRLTLKS